MRVLLSNDDGVHAIGIRTLYHELKDIAETIIVAPLEERSTTGHTLSIDHPLRLFEIEKNIYGCSGYPADCTLLATGHLFKKAPVDLVISGINKGSNLGQDIYYSGTVAAAREATLHGTRSIAVSLNFSRHDNEKDLAYKSAAEIIYHIVKERIFEKIPKHAILNINVPNLPISKIKSIEITTLGERIYSQMIDERVDFKGRKYYWIGGQLIGHEEIPGTDALCVENGSVSMTLINIFPHTPINELEWNSAAEYLSKILLKK